MMTSSGPLRSGLLNSKARDSEAGLESLNDLREDDGYEQEDRRHDRKDLKDVSGERVPVCNKRDFRLHPEDEHERAGLKQTDVLVGQRRDDQAKSLGQHDVPHRTES